LQADASTNDQHQRQPESISHRMETNRLRQDCESALTAASSSMMVRIYAKSPRDEVAMRTGVGKGEWEGGSLAVHRWRQRLLPRKFGPNAAIATITTILLSCQADNTPPRRARAAHRRR